MIPLGTEVGLVLDGDPAIPPQFSANVRCGQTVGSTKMPLGMEVGHGGRVGWSLTSLFSTNTAMSETKVCYGVAAPP